LCNTADLKECRRVLLQRHSLLCDKTGLSQAIVTLLCLAAIWAGVWVIDRSVMLSPLAKVASTLALAALMSLFLLRVFVLMHECGHASLFKSDRFNRVFGFVFGVVAGMPQAVWSRNHQYHHTTNGNWDRYRGPMNVIKVDEYHRLSQAQQRRYRYSRNLLCAPLGGLLYLVIWPRINWLRASMRLVQRITICKVANPTVSLRSIAREFQTPYCTSLEDYGHMFWNNLALLCWWAAMSWALGPLLFFACYIGALSLAGGGAIVLFTVQHNFEHSYASEATGWDRNLGILEGTSFLQLPGWLNWFTANIAYHHIHHLCARIPNYRLAAGHLDRQCHFAGVQRIGLKQIPASLRYILWDAGTCRLVSVAEAGKVAAAALA